MKTKQAALILSILLITILLGNCRPSSGETQEVVLTLGAYTVPKEVYQQEIIPAFQTYWKEKTGQQVRFQESYLASGAQSRAIASGFEADIAALSLENDIVRLEEKGLITHDWKKKKYNGMVTGSLVVMVTRSGSPRTANLSGWEDLYRLQLDVIYPSPKTSGGAMWVVNAIYGSGLKEMELQYRSDDANERRQALDFARERLKKVQQRVKVMDKSGRASVTTFENGFGDVLITYENEALLRKKQGKELEYIIPDATIAIQNPIVLVDRYVDKHGTRDVAEAFITFVHTKEAQRRFARYGFRPVDKEVAAEFAHLYPVPPDLFDVSYLGGWGTIYTQLYGENGIWTSIVMELAHEK